MFNVLNSQESGLKVNQPASFAIRLNGAKGKIDAKVHSPSGAVEECHVSELEPGKPEAGRAGPGICTSPRHISTNVLPSRGLMSLTEASQTSDSLLLLLPGVVYKSGYKHLPGTGRCFGI